MNHKTDFDDLTRRVEEIKKEKETSRLEDANRRKYQMWKRDNPRLRSAEGLIKYSWTNMVTLHLCTPACDLFIRKDSFFFNFYWAIQSSVILVIIKSILSGVILYWGSWKILGGIQSAYIHLKWINHPVPGDIRFEDGLMLIILLVG